MTTSTASRQTTDSSHRRILSLTWPVLLANLTLPMVGAVDTAIMGRLPDPAYIGAVALGSMIITSCGWLFGFLRMGTTGLVAQAFGGDRLTQALMHTRRGIRLALIIGVVLLVASPLILPLLLAAFGPSADVGALATRYLSIRAFALPAILLYLVLLGTLFGLQAMRAALFASLLLNLSSTLLSLTLAVGFELGLDGVAFGSLLADWLSALGAVALTRRAFRERGLGSIALLAAPSSEVSTEQNGTWQRTLTMNADLLVRSLFVQAPFLIYTAMGARLGDVVLAANAILMQLYFFLVFALDAFAHTAETLAGASIGADDRSSFDRVVERTALWSLALGLAGGLMFLTATPLLVSALTTSDAVYDEALRYRLWLAVAPALSALAFQLDGIFIGATRSRTMRNAMALSFVGFAVVVALGVEPLGNHALWAGLLTFMVLRGLLLGRALSDIRASLV
ncbi:MAG: MATE family efflux transporter [Pseudomonadota bacterium]